VTSAISSLKGSEWLLENGPAELELLFRFIVFHPTLPILIVDNDRKSRDASVGAAKLLGLPREKLIGRQLDEFAEPDFKPVISEQWRAFLEQGQQEGTLRLVDPHGSQQEVEYLAKKNVLPVRHLLVLNNKTSKPGATDSARTETHEPANAEVPPWVQDYGLCLLDVDGLVVAWYAGSERLYGYSSASVVGQHWAVFYAGLRPNEDALQIKLQDELTRAAAAGHIGTEGWQIRQDGSRFWANAITMALKTTTGSYRALPGWFATSPTVTNGTKRCGVAGPNLG
jgi:formate hydrogenlyase transcriptional activator